MLVTCPTCYTHSMDEQYAFGVWNIVPNFPQKENPDHSLGVLLESLTYNLSVLRINLLLGSLNCTTVHNILQDCFLGWLHLEEHALILVCVP